ncbi:NAD-dependent epimerase/dehydratase family protein [Candidatus Palauibacter sp.]|uniref:NAD-dependent epimerase/dehydratase family protein n=1 Tax=Candidatus Palauibacter sp. TaxID=3101350 RepID=UPI003B5CFEFE
METEYALACEELRAAPRRWLVTGAAGFIGSNLLEQLLRLGQEVVVLDDLSTGRLHNIEEAVAASGAPADRCRFIEADAADRDAALEACRGVDIVLHQAAMGSVPRSNRGAARDLRLQRRGFRQRAGRGPPERRPTCRVYGDGRSSRDFFYVDDAVQANLLAATAEASATGAIYNVASGDPTILNELFDIIRDGLARMRPELRDVEPFYEQFRAGDIRHSYADISRARLRLGYVPTHSLAQGLELTLDWYTAH